MSPSLPVLFKPQSVCASPSYLSVFRVVTCVFIVVTCVFIVVTCICKSVLVGFFFFFFFFAFLFFFFCLVVSVSVYCFVLGFGNLVFHQVREQEPPVFLTFSFRRSGLREPDSSLMREIEASALQGVGFTVTRFECS